MTDAFKRDLERFSGNPLGLTKSPLIDYLNYVPTTDKSVQLSWLLRATRHASSEEAQQYLDGQLSLEDITPMKDILGTMDAVIFASLVSSRRFHSKPSITIDSPVIAEVGERDTYLPQSETRPVISKIERSAITKQDGPVYIGTRSAIMELLHSGAFGPLRDSPFSSRFVVLGDKNEQLLTEMRGSNDEKEDSISSFVVRSCSDCLGNLVFNPGESPDALPAPFLKIHTTAPPNTPGYAIQAGVCFYVVPNLEAIELIDLRRS